MEIIRCRMDDGQVEMKLQGETIHATVEDIRRFYSDTAAYLLEKEGQVDIIVDRNKLSVTVR